MEAAAIPDITPDSLRADAQANRDRAEALRQETVRLRADAARMDREADALAEALRLASLAPVRVPAHVELAGDLVVWFRRQRVPKSSTEIAEANGVTVNQIRPALAWLVEAKVIVREGLKRGTRYAVNRGNCEAPTPFGQRWHEVIRDIAIRLDTFTFAEARNEVPNVSEATVARWLAVLVEEEILSVERVEGRNLYAYERPQASAIPFSRPRTPDVIPNLRAPSEPVEGTGVERIGRKDIRDLVRLAEANGATIKRTKHGYAIAFGGKTVASVPSTPSDHRSLDNARAALRNVGIPA